MPSKYSYPPCWSIWPWVQSTYPGLETRVCS